MPFGSIDIENLSKSDIYKIEDTIVEYILEDCKKNGNIVTSRQDVMQHALLTMTDSANAVNAKDQSLMDTAVTEFSGQDQRGVKQSMFGNIAPEDMPNILEEIKLKYGITDEEALFLIDKSRHSNCSVATTTGLFLEIAKDNPDEFYRKTGIRVFVEQNGKNVLNTAGVYLDTFVHSNSFEDGFITRNPDGSITVDTNTTKENSAFGNGLMGYDVEKANQYLRDKGFNEQFVENEKITGFRSTYASRGCTEADMLKISQKVKEAVNVGKSVTLGVTPIGENKLGFIIPSKSERVKCNGPHMMEIYGANSTGLVVDTTWGTRGILPYVELMESVSQYNISILEKVKK